VARIQPLILDSLRSASQFEPEKLEVEKRFYIH
jgi:hypothetical protein